jgi:hypothetical protein
MKTLLYAAAIGAGAWIVSDVVELLTGGFSVASRAATI